MAFGGGNVATVTHRRNQTVPTLTGIQCGAIVVSQDAPSRMGIVTDRHRDSGTADKQAGITSPFPCDMTVTA
jgi:hypothetical protein